MSVNNLPMSTGNTLAGTTFMSTYMYTPDDPSLDELFLLSEDYPYSELEVRLKGLLLRPSNIHRLLSAFHGWEVVEYVEQRSKAINITNSIYRCINHSMILKTKIYAIKYYESWFSVVLSVEESVDEITLVKKYFKTSTKKRWTYLKKYVKIDVTYIITEDIWQVELELYPPRKKYKQKHKKALMDSVEEVIGILQDSPLYITRKRFELVKEIVDNLTPTFSVTRHYYQKPITLDYVQLQKILSGNYLMTPKVDGYRLFIVLFNGMVYSVDTNTHVRLLHTGLTSYTSSRHLILDAEWVDPYYFIFDLVDPYKLWKERQVLLKQTVEFLQEVPPNPEKKEYYWQIKKYHPVPSHNTIPSIHSYWKKINKEMDTRGVTLDGIIFMDPSRKYRNYVWKWKPVITIDLEIKKESGHKGDTDKDIVCAHPNIPSMDYVFEVNREIISQDGVYEFQVLTQENSNIYLKVLRFRNDKFKPNGIKVIENNIFHGLPLIYIWNGRSCFLMRKYHNLVKRKLLGSNYTTLLDIGSGQGGDLNKWKKKSTIYCIEPNKEAVREFRRRIRDKEEGTRKPQIHLLKKSIQEVHWLCRKIPPKSVNKISLFFCLNLIKEELPFLFDVIQHVASEKCSIVGIFLDGKQITREISSECFQISHLSEDSYEISLFETRIISQKEYKFYMKDLSPLTEMGFELESTKLLKNNNLSKRESQLTSFFRSFCFQRG